MEIYEKVKRYLYENIGHLTGPGTPRFDLKTETWKVPVLKGVWGQTTVRRYFLFLTTINFSLMRLIALTLYPLVGFPKKFSVL